MIGQGLGSSLDVKSTISFGSWWRGHSSGAGGIDMIAMHEARSRSEACQSGVWSQSGSIKVDIHIRHAKCSFNRASIKNDTVTMVARDKSVKLVYHITLSSLHCLAVGCASHVSAHRHTCLFGMLSNYLSGPYKSI